MLVITLPALRVGTAPHGNNETVLESDASAMRVNRKDGIEMASMKVLPSALALSALLKLAFAIPCLAQQTTGPRYDLLIIHGHVVDGSGSPWFEASVAVKDGKVADIGRLEGAAATRVIDARGLVVAPGFIDLHSHSDYTLLVDGTAQSKIRQGVTTEILGEAASAAGPARTPRSIASPARPPPRIATS